LRSIFARFWPLTKPLRTRLYISLVLVVVAPVLSTAEIGMFKILIDRVVVPHDFHLFPLIAVTYLGLTLLEGAVSFTDQYLSTWVGERFVLILRTRLFSHLHRLSSGFFDSRPLGDLLSRLTGDTGAIETLVLSGVAAGVTYVTKLVLFTGAMFYLDWRLAGASLLAAPGFLGAARVFSRRIKTASREKRRRVAAITSVAEESFGNAALIRAYDRAEAEDTRFHTQNQAVFTAQMSATRLQAVFGPLTDVIETIGVLLVIGLAIWELAAGRISIGGLLVFMAYMAQLYSPIQGLSSLMNSLYAASAGAERVIELLDETPTITNPTTPTSLDRAAGALRVHQVGFTYPGTDAPALSGIDLDIAAGQTVAIVGASGAGKSTLAKLLLRFYDPDVGSITLDGIDLRQLPLPDLYRNIATVLQETLVFDGTVRENILWGQPEATDHEIIAAATAADAHEFITALPLGYDTPIGQRGRKLSGGQRQRVAIARALIRDAPVLLLDEPTTGLDADSTRRVLTPLRRLIAGRTMIIISHNLLTVTDADAILYLEHGRIAGTGTHTQLLHDCPGYRRLYHLHQHPDGPHLAHPPLKLAPVHPRPPTTAIHPPSIHPPPRRPRPPPRLPARPSSSPISNSSGSATAIRITASRPLPRSVSACPAAAVWRSWVPAARANPPCCGCSPDNCVQAGAQSASTATICPTSTHTGCGNASPWSPPTPTLISTPTATSALGHRDTPTTTRTTPATAALRSAPAREQTSAQTPARKPCSSTGSITWATRYASPPPKQAPPQPRTPRPRTPRMGQSATWPLVGCGVGGPRSAARCAPDPTCCYWTTPPWASTPTTAANYSAPCAYSRSITPC
jgi:ABC-type multidrug transport system fused ATPase/permease subunit